MESREAQGKKKLLDLQGPSAVEGYFHGNQSWV
jgi:hypothetical protein